MTTFAEILNQERAHWESVSQQAAAARTERAERHEPDLLAVRDLAAGVVEAQALFDVARAAEAEASEARAAAYAARVAATAARDRAIRRAYANGASARQLVEVAGVSVPRVNQIVAGARS